MFSDIFMKSERLFLRSTLNYDGYPEYLQAQGCDVAKLREELSIGPEIYNKQVNIVPWNAVATLYERAAKELKDPCLGLRYALHAKPDFSGIGPVIYMGAVSSDVRSMFKLIEAYQSIRTNGMIYKLEENTDTQEILGVYEFSPYSAPYRQILENTAALSALTAQKLIPGFNVKYVSLPIARRKIDHFTHRYLTRPYFLMPSEMYSRRIWTFMKPKARNYLPGFENLPLKLFLMATFKDRLKPGNLWAILLIKFYLKLLGQIKAILKHSL